MFQKWQRVLFQSSLNDLLSQIPQQYLNWLQFSLIMRQGNIKFRGLNQQLKFRKLFQDKQNIDKDTLISCIIVCETLVSNNKRFYIIKMKQSQQSMVHKPAKCFSWWKQFMVKNYGLDLKWFDVIANKKDTFKIKSFDFKLNISRILSNTQHNKCSQKICSFFPKNQKNQIQFSIFINTIKATSQSAYHQSSPSKKSISQRFNHLNVSKSKTFQTQPSHQKLQKLNAQTSQTFYATQWSPSSPCDQKMNKYETNHMKGRYFRKKVSKSINTLYSLPIKDILHKHKTLSKYENWINTNI